MQEWWIDEVDFAGAEHLDERYVAGYDGKAQFDPAEDLAALARHGIGPGSRIVDLGAGTGTFATAAAAAGAHVVAVDVSAPMVDALSRRTIETEAPGTVEVVQAGFLTYDHPEPLADAVFSRNALHQVPDLWKAVAIQRIAGMVRSGGIFRLRDLCFDLEPASLDEVVADWMASAATDASRGYTAEELATHVREEFSTYTWLLEPMLRRAGFEILDREHRRSVYAAYTCRRS